MAEHNETGLRGEDLAVEYLKENGFEILERNWRSRHEEIDIIARERSELVIVEVKTRSARHFGMPEESVTLRKQRNLVNAAEEYIRRKNSNLETRFDVVSVILNGEKSEIRHIPRAFSPFD
ncbi:MAG: YraN family protein [Bacteroidetes bacterium]|nr:YraN family protein [Bacteroidota bacterium]